MLPSVLCIRIECRPNMSVEFKVRFQCPDVENIHIICAFSCVQCDHNSWKKHNTCMFCDILASDNPINHVQRWQQTWSNACSVCICAWRANILIEPKMTAVRCICVKHSALWQCIRLGKGVTLHYNKWWEGRTPYHAMLKDVCATLSADTPA